MTLNLISICSFTIQAIQIMPFYTYYTQQGKKNNGRKRIGEWAGERKKNQQKNREGRKVRNKGIFCRLFCYILLVCCLSERYSFYARCMRVCECVLVFIPVLSHFSIVSLYIFGLDERKKIRDWKKFTFMV